MRLYLAKNKSGLLEAEFDAPRWRQGDQVIRHLKKRFKARIINEAEGPDARRWTLRVQGTEIVVDQDDFGVIFIRAKDASSDALVTRIAESVQKEVT